jgi:hypothetical protein
MELLPFNEKHETINLSPQLFQLVYERADTSIRQEIRKKFPELFAVIYDWEKRKVLSTEPEHGLPLYINEGDADFPHYKCLIVHEDWNMEVVKGGLRGEEQINLIFTKKN